MNEWGRPAIARGRHS